ncbi:MAG TPA: PhzF family phenazine biosynthesis protein [Vicinamibacterales bacterium]|nr:PhzF family phenazine biosynthesis protein [Vicinamibacterales bacterium]
MPHYLHYDVFTNRPFEGNQLAVFPDARGLPAERMQVITREMNFSESTFVLPAHRGSVVRRAVPPRAPRFARRGGPRRSRRGRAAPTAEGAGSVDV